MVDPILLASVLEGMPLFFCAKVSFRLQDFPVEMAFPLKVEIPGKILKVTWQTETSWMLFGTFHLKNKFIVWITGFSASFTNPF